MIDSLRYINPFDSINRTRHYLVLFIIWPFLAFVCALADYNHKEARRVVYFFLVYYGLSFVIIGTGVDAYRSMLRLQEYSQLPFREFLESFNNIYSSNETMDFYEMFISFVVSRVSTKHNLLFGAYAAVFGFFYLKSIELLFDRFKERPGINAFILMLFFAMIIPITTINGVRFYTAVWIFFYGAIHVICYRNPKYLLLVMSSVLVHWSFLSASAILMAYYFIGNKNYIYLPLVIASFILPQLISPYIQVLSLRFGGGLQSRVEMYTNEYVLEATQQEVQQLAWFMQIGYDLVFYYLLIALAAISIFYRKLIDRAMEKNVLSFLLLFLAFVNFGKSIPSFGNRFQSLFFIFATYFLFLVLQKLPSQKMNILVWLGLFPMLLYTAIVLRQGSDSINAWMFMPGLGLPLVLPSLSLAEILFN